MENTYGTFFMALNDVVSNTAVYLPKIAAAVVVFVFGWIIAKIIAGAIHRLFKVILGANAIKKAPIDHFLNQDQFGHKIEEIIAKVVYWMVMLVVIHTTVAVLGLTSLTALLEQIINYIPHMAAAFIVFIFGIILAGLVESLVKSAVRSINGKDNHSSMVAGKLAGYFVFSIASLAAISELGIASEFILILFIGFVMMFSLGFALAIGLGTKDIIRDLLQDWYKQSKTKK